MPAGNTPGSERRSRRSTILGIAVLVAIALIVLALVFGFLQDDEDDPDAPSVYAPVLVASSPAADVKAPFAA